MKISVDEIEHQVAVPHVQVRENVRFLVINRLLIELPCLQEDYRA